MNALSTGMVFCLAGGVAAASTPRLAPGGTMPSREVAHFYINAGTGEIVVTRVGGGAPAGRGVSPESWAADNDLPCAAFGQTQGTAGVVDDPFGVYDDPQTGQTHLDWGDTLTDTVVDAVQVTWATQHQDTDGDGDGVGDGVEGFGAFWAWYDGDNGFNGNYRTGLVGFTLSDLPGVVGPVDPNLLAEYHATVDLASSFSSSITFEICDTDSDPQGAAVHNANFGNQDLDSNTVPDSDLDGDGLADFGYSQRFYQPGTTDFDGDGDPDGDPGAVALTGIGLVAPTGPAVFDGTGWTIDPVAPLPAGQGMEDAFDVYTDLNGDGFWEPVGTFWYGGFSCDEDGDGVPGADDSNPFAQMEHTLYGPSTPGPCPGDIFPPGGNGVLNYFDVAAFITAFGRQDPIADFAAPFGVFNIFDVTAYLAVYNAGCP